MSRSGATAPHPLSVALFGAVVSFVLTVMLLTFRDEHDVPLSSFVIAAGAGLLTSVLSWLLIVRLNRRAIIWEFQIEHLRTDGIALKDLESEIFTTRHNLRRSFRPGNHVYNALNEASELFDKLRSLAIDGPDPEDYDFDGFMIAVEWESILSELYPLARAGDITRARLVGRFSWRRRLLVWYRQRWWTLQDRSVVRWLRTYRRRSTRRGRRRRCRRRRGRRDD